MRRYFVTAGVMQGQHYTQEPLNKEVDRLPPEIAETFKNFAQVDGLKLEIIGRGSGYDQEKPCHVQTLYCKADEAQYEKLKALGWTTDKPSTSNTNPFRNARTA